MWDQAGNIFRFPCRVTLHAFGLSDKDKKFLKDLRRELGEVIYKGTVKEESWKEYPQSTALLTDDREEYDKQEYHKQECDFWQERGFFSYGWINWSGFQLRVENNQEFLWLCFIMLYDWFKNLPPPNRSFRSKAKCYLTFPALGAAQSFTISQSDITKNTWPKVGCNKGTRLF